MENTCNCGFYPTIVVPGIGNCKAFEVDENGNPLPGVTLRLEKLGGLFSDDTSVKEWTSTVAEPEQPGQTVGRREPVRGREPEPVRTGHQPQRIADPPENAANLDGGTSSYMYYDGALVNDSAALYGTRKLPTAWIVK